jgi:hypothetical protein
MKLARAGADVNTQRFKIWFTQSQIQTCDMDVYACVHFHHINYPITINSLIMDYANGHPPITPSMEQIPFSLS